MCVGCALRSPSLGFQNFTWNLFDRYIERQPQCWYPALILHSALMKNTPRALISFKSTCGVCNNSPPHKRRKRCLQNLPEKNISTLLENDSILQPYVFWLGSPTQSGVCMCPFSYNPHSFFAISTAFHKCETPAGTGAGTRQCHLLAPAQRHLAGGRQQRVSEVYRYAVRY